jgi:hypothetical protein
MTLDNKVLLGQEKEFRHVLAGSRVPLKLFQAEGKKAEYSS